MATSPGLRDVANLAHGCRRALKLGGVRAIDANDVGHRCEHIVDEGLWQDRDEHVLGGASSPAAGETARNAIQRVSTAGITRRRLAAPERGHGGDSTCHTNGWTRWMAAWMQSESRFRCDEMNSTRRSHRIAANVRKMAVSSNRVNSAEKSTWVWRTTPPPPAGPWSIPERFRGVAARAARKARARTCISPLSLSVGRTRLSGRVNG